MENTTIDYSWQKDASCSALSAEQYDAFYPGQGKSPDKEALLLCTTCPVYDNCLNHALLYEDYGYWAGTSTKQRRMLRQELGIKLIDIDYESTLEVIAEVTKQQQAVAIKSSKKKRGPKRKKEECESDLLSQF